MQKHAQPRILPAAAQPAPPSLERADVMELHARSGGRGRLDPPGATGGVVAQRIVTVNLRAPRTTATTTQKERATLHDAEERPVGEIRLHITGHRTHADRDGDGFADPDEIIVLVRSRQDHMPLS
jgi:hypothetical protein